MKAPGTVLITGAAGAIGSVTVQLFLDSGWHVLGLDQSPSVLDLAGDRYLGVQADAVDEASTVAALQRLSDLPGLGHLVAIAGGALSSEPRTQGNPILVEIDDFRSSLDQNLVSQFVSLKSALPFLRTSGDFDRSVTLTSSFNALSGYGMPAYSAAKAGLIGMMNALVGPLGQAGIRINTVAPGTIRTPRTERIWTHVPGHFEQLAESAALGRVGAPIDVARAYSALALNLTHVTGQVLLVDGGQSKLRS